MAFWWLLHRWLCRGFGGHLSRIVEQDALCTLLLGQPVGSLDGVAGAPGSALPWGSGGWSRRRCVSARTSSAPRAGDTACSSTGCSRAPGDGPADGETLGGDSTLISNGGGGRSYVHVAAHSRTAFRVRASHSQCCGARASSPVVMHGDGAAFSRARSARGTPPHDVVMVGGLVTFTTPQHPQNGDGRTQPMGRATPAASKFSIDRVLSMLHCKDQAKDNASCHSCI